MRQMDRSVRKTKESLAPAETHATRHRRKARRYKIHYEKNQEKKSTQTEELKAAEMAEQEQFEQRSSPTELLDRSENLKKSEERDSQLAPKRYARGPNHRQRRCTPSDNNPASDVGTAAACDVKTQISLSQLHHVRDNPASVS